jgi:hypothetical protein
VIDLCDSTIISALGTTIDNLCAVRIPGAQFFAQVLGDYASAIGCDGLWVWSAQAPGTKNLVVLPQNAPPLTLPYYVITALRNP